jgi:hypothetical protein
MRHVPVQEEIAAGPCIGRHPRRASARRHPWRKGRTKKDLDRLHADPLSCTRGAGDSRYGSIRSISNFSFLHRPPRRIAGDRINCRICFTQICLHRSSAHTDTVEEEGLIGAACAGRRGDRYQVHTDPSGSL